MFLKGHAKIISYLHSLSCTDSADSVMWPDGHDPHPNHGSGYRAVSYTHLTLPTITEV